MRHLVCSNATSAQAETKLKASQTMYEKYKALGNMEMVSSMIFSCFDLKSNFYQLAGLLAVSDEWKVPISASLANILFFSLCVNCNDKARVKIRTITQGSMLFKETENDYKLVLEYEEDTKMRFETFEAGIGFKCLFPGTEISFKIPVRFFRNRKTGVTQRTLGLQKFFKIVLNGEETQVPIAYLIPFFSTSLNAKGNIGIMVGQEEKISSKFEFNTKALYDLIIYCGYSRNKQINADFSLPNGPIMINNYKLVLLNAKNISNSLPDYLWTDIGNNKVFLPNVDYLLIQEKDQYIVLTKQ